MGGVAVSTQVDGVLSTNRRLTSSGRESAKMHPKCTKKSPLLRIHPKKCKNAKNVWSQSTVAGDRNYEIRTTNYEIESAVWILPVSYYVL
jgi:hypothetical protein